MKRLLPLALLLPVLIMGQDCEPAPPPEPNPQGGTDYCYGLEYSILDSVVQGVKGAYNTIIDGEVSVNRRATVRVLFGNASCTGVVISPHTVLTAAHCGYKPGLEHRISVEGNPAVFRSTESLYHPDYQAWIDYKEGLAVTDVYDGGQGDAYNAATGTASDVVALAEEPTATANEGRRADIMLLFFGDQSIPPPYISIHRNTYSSDLAPRCYGLIAQGLGRDGDGVGGTMRESDYKITLETERAIQSLRTDAGKTCFGDSGGPLYADVGPGQLYLAGITSTTFSGDCLIGGSHVKIAYPPYKAFLFENTRP